MALAMGVATLFSCSDDNNNSSAYDNGVKVTLAETAIKAAGGAATIEVDKPVTTAYSTDNWLKVNIDGNKVSAAADRNDSRESRFSTVVVKASDTDSTIVSVSQLGTVFGYTDGRVVVENEGGMAQRFVLHNAEFHVKEAPDWVTASVKGDSVYVDVAANADGNMRKGYVCLESGNYVDTLSVVQASFDESIAGSYVLSYYDVQFDDQGNIAGIAPAETSADVYTFNGNIRVYIPEFGYSLIADYDPKTLSLSFKSAQIVGTLLNMYYQYELAISADLDMGVTSDSYSNFTFDLDKDTNKKYATFGGNVNGADAFGLMFILTSGIGLTTDNLVGIFKTWFLPQLDEDSFDAAAKRKMMSPAQISRVKSMAKAMMFKQHLSGKIF